MSNILTPLRGMKDLLPDDFRIHKHIEEIAFNTAKLYGYEGFATPMLEYVSVFDRTLGEESDVVSKEMYSFHDKKGRHIALRPEFTASVMRAFISNGLKQKLPLKLFSSGALFRYDRPQKGRQRQFHQLNFEYLGASGAYSDAETIALAAHVLENLGLLADVTLELNSLGCRESKQNYQAALSAYFAQYVGELSEDSKKRLEKNPILILDSKDESDKKIAKDAPVITDYYTKDAASYFQEVRSNLDMLGVSYVVNPRLARGLDYYSHTAFEFVTTSLGAQSTVLAGGRYDGLSELMGGDKMPAIGFAAGIERIALMGEFSPAKERRVYVIPIGAECADYASRVTNILRRGGVQTSLSFEGKIAKRMQSALAADASFVVFIGSEEKAKGTYKLKDLDAGSEIEVNSAELLEITQQQVVQQQIARQQIARQQVAPQKTRQGQ